MRDEILNYWEMCSREGMSLQRGMNFRALPRVSILLMSQRTGAPYQDLLSEDGTVLAYEGHDVRKSSDIEPKKVDQPWEESPGRPSENAKFAQAAKSSKELAPLVRVYEKLRQGIWSDRGLFYLTGYTYRTKDSESRQVFKFNLEISNKDEQSEPEHVEQTRIIPSWVKQLVYKRDKAKCVMCGATDQLHFDHELPFSRGGTSVRPENIRILCARHNLQKGARIE
jgi:HNH endonuclease